MPPALLSIEHFGAILLESGDLDPVYIALVKACPEPARLYRWMVAYWCFYSAGFASWASDREGPEFWRVMALAAANDTEAPCGGRWPRGAERRHFRGHKAVGAVDNLRLQFPVPEDLVMYVAVKSCNGAGRSLGAVMDVVQALPMFGEWIAFKVADMLDRCTPYTVSFDGSVFLFKDPLEGAYMAAEAWGMRGVRDMSRGRVASFVLGELLDKFSHYRAPPRYDRPVGINEAETILCKWKSHQKGHYPPGKDTDELRHALPAWAKHSQTAGAFLEALPTLQAPF